MSISLPTLTTVEREPIARLGEELTLAGYADFCSTFDPLRPRLEQWLEHRDDAPRELQRVIDLFLLSRSVRLEELPEGVRNMAIALSAEGVFTRAADDTVRTRGLVLLPVLGYWLFFQKPTRNPTMYFGDDSMALACRLRPKVGGRTLDLCAGPGIQSLLASGISASVTAVELNPAAAQVAWLNVAINGREDRIEVLAGDLYEPLPRLARYDHISANPPLLPMPPDLKYPFVGDGGPDGLGVTWRILDGLPARLAPDGIAQVVGTCLSDGILPFPADRLSAWCRDAAMDVRLTVAAQVELTPGSPMFDGLVKTADRGDGASVYRDFLGREGATHLATFLLTVQFGRGRLTVQDMSRDGQAGLWFV